MDSSAVVEWQNLPKDMLLIIAELSNVRLLRAVCSSWRSSLPLPNKSPLLSIKIPLPNDVNEGYDLISDSFYFILSERSIYCLEPLHDDTYSIDAAQSLISSTVNLKEYTLSWIVKLEETSSGKMRLLNTLSNLYAFPVSREELPDVLNLFDYRVMRVGKEYNLRRVHPQTIVGNKHMKANTKALKVVMSDDGHAIMCIFSDGTLGYFKLGDANWTMINHGEGRVPSYSDVTYYNGNFHVIDSFGRTIVINPSLTVKVAESSIHGDFFNGIHRYFVQSNRDLFVLIKYYTGNYNLRYARFKVYRLDMSKNIWIGVPYLVDHALFIGGDCCFSVSTKQFSGFKKCIYYDNNIVEKLDKDDGEPGFVVGFFQLKGHLRSYTRYCQIFWPIPWWLKPKDKRKPEHQHLVYKRLEQR